MRPARNASLSLEKSQRLPIQSAGYEVAIFPPTTRWDGIMAATASPNIILPAKRLSGYGSPCDAGRRSSVLTNAPWRAARTSA